MVKSWPRPRKSGLRAKSTTPPSPSNAIDYCLRRSGSSTPEDLDLRRLLRQAPIKIRPSPGDVPGLRPAAGYASFMSGHAPVWLKREAVHCPGGRSARGLGGRLQQANTSSPSTTKLMPPARFFPSPFEEAAILTLRRGRRMGDGQQGRTAGATSISPDSRSMRFPAFAGPALFRVYLLLRVQASTPANTSSWAWLPMASRSYADFIRDKMLDLKDGRLVPPQPVAISITAPGLTMTSPEASTRALRRSASQGPSRRYHRAGNGPGCLDPARSLRRSSSAAFGPCYLHAQTGLTRTSAWPAAWR